MSEILKISGLHKSFGGIVVARDINLSIAAGQVLGLIGPNGAGKTSLFNLVSGVVRPDAGEVRLNGASLNRLSIPARARQGLARTWQNLRLFESLTVLDNLMIGTRLYPGESMWNLFLRPGQLRAHERASVEKAMDILENIGLQDEWDTPITDLSYGQQKLVGVARALMNDAVCLLLDEPMAGVEGNAYETMQRVVQDAAARGVAVCVVEHNVSFVKDLCDSAVFMFSGQILASGTVDELISDERLTELYFGT